MFNKSKRQPRKELYHQKQLSCPEQTGIAHQHITMYPAELETFNTDMYSVQNQGEITNFG